MKKIAIALILSLLFHLSQYFLVRTFGQDNMSQNKTDLTQVELIETPQVPTKAKEKPIVRTLQNPNTPTEVKDTADFKAETTNRVKEQTIARNLGKFQNTGGNGKNNQQQQQQQSAQINREERPKLPEGDFFKQQQHLGGGSIGSSQREFDLPRDIKMANTTVLNTDADIYASFYNRVTDLFYIRWVQRLDNINNQMALSTKQNLSNRTWTTEVEIHLNPRGEYLQGLVMKKSGFQPFDGAALYAFQNARYFPNPPKAKVDPDGIIRLKYRLAVHIGYL